jgi:hypothetical protein
MLKLSLGPICVVTTTVPSLAEIEPAYTRYLGYRVMARGAVCAEMAAAWRAPAATGCRMLTLAPEVGEETLLRFIEDPEAGTVRPFTTHGWNATEFTVRDTDALAERLANSPFSLLGPPANLKGFEHIRAMQVLGPAGECLYFTDVSRDPALAQARAAVGQVFIVVAGGTSMRAMQDFLTSGFDNEISAPVEVPVGVINRANALPAGMRHKLSLVTLPGGCRIEFDQYPPITGTRPTRAGHLPPGMSVVSFRVDRLRGAMCVTGAAGELIELKGKDAGLL